MLILGERVEADVLLGLAFIDVLMTTFIDVFIKEATLAIICQIVLSNRFREGYLKIVKDLKENIEC